VIERTVRAELDAVWAALMDASTYPRWVVGAKRFRRSDETWPEPGSRFHHAVGIGPLELKDDTKLLERDDLHRVKLEARARPAGRAHVEMTLEDLGDGATLVRMSEEAVTGVAAWIPARVQAPFVDARNREGLRRFARIVERGAATERR
jgi:uncharacterized protein YndB with AHSA1/START domain